MLKYVFTYINNKDKIPVVLLKLHANSILTADLEFQRATGFDPVKCSWIGCTIEPVL